MSFLKVFSTPPWQNLFRGSVEGVDPKIWRGHLVTDRAQRKRQQGPTPNQEIGGLACWYMYEHLTNGPGQQDSQRRFLKFLDSQVKELMGGEENSPTYYRYYLAGAAVAVKFGEKFNHPQTAECGNVILRSWLAILDLHNTPEGIGFPGARAPLGMLGSEHSDTIQLLKGETPKKLQRKKLDDLYECAAWSLRELGRKFEPMPLGKIRLRWPLKFSLYEGGEWLSEIIGMQQYDPCWAVSYVRGELHALRWIAPSGRHKAEITRKMTPEMSTSDGLLYARYPSIEWETSIPTPSGKLLEEITIK